MDRSLMKRSTQFVEFVNRFDNRNQKDKIYQMEEAEK